MYLTTTGVCIATLTRFGREVAAENSVNFKITQYRLSDDEIDYSLFDSTPNSDQSNILNTPILEACTLGGVASQKYYLQTLSKETQQVAYIDTNIDYPFVDGEQNKRIRREKITVLVDINSFPNLYTFKVRTFYGADSNYIVQSQQPKIIVPVNSNYLSIPCTDPFENRQNQTEVSISLSWNLTDDTPVIINTSLLESIFPTTVEIVNFKADQSITAEPQEMEFSTGEVIKKGNSSTWGIIKAASCIVHITGVTTQKGYDIEFLLYDGLVLSQREIPIQPSSIENPTVTKVSQLGDNLSFNGGGASIGILQQGRWVVHPEQTK